MSVTCFWLESAGLTQAGLRRYGPSSGKPDPPCPRESGKWGYHGALVILAQVPIAWSDVRPEGHGHWFLESGNRFGVADFTYPDHDDPRWPSCCECGYEFTPDDAWQEWEDRLYRRADTGELVTLRDAPPGAMWDAAWYYRKGPDGRCLTVKCPNGDEWIIDSQAANCTMPDDDEHYCWVRHGDPPAVTVDKAGNTCAAGAGSIQAGGYHGFLRGGVFEP